MVCPLELEEIEELSRDRIVTRISTTEKQIELMQNAISDASKQKKQMDSQMYSTMIRGYEGILKDLKTDLENYSEVLKTKQ
jgi:hypothetical protein